MKTSRRFLLVALCLTGVLLGCPRADASEGEVVARVGDIEVTREELRAYVATLGVNEQAALARDPALLGQVTRSYLARRLLTRTARAKGFEAQPAVKAQLDRMRDDALAELYVESVSTSPEGYPSEAELKAAYDARAASFDVPPGYRVAQIFITARAGDAAAEAKAKARLEVVQRKLATSGADFAAVAREESDERATAAAGGEIGWLSEAQLLPAIRSTVLALEKGRVSAPVHLDEGWHVVKLLDTRAAARRTLPEVRDALAAQLRRDRAEANRRTYMARLLEQSPPVINELALSNLLPKPLAAGGLSSSR
jgi:peptidylprolyl isomerase